MKYLLRNDPRCKELRKLVETEVSAHELSRNKWQSQFLRGGSAGAFSGFMNADRGISANNEVKLVEALEKSRVERQAAVRAGVSEPPPAPADTPEPAPESDPSDRQHDMLSKTKPTFLNDKGNELVRQRLRAAMKPGESIAQLSLRLTGAITNLHSLMAGRTGSTAKRANKLLEALGHPERFPEVPALRPTYQGKRQSKRGRAKPEKKAGRRASFGRKFQKVPASDLVSLRNRLKRERARHTTLNGLARAMKSTKAALNSILRGKGSTSTTVEAIEKALGEDRQGDLFAKKKPPPETTLARVENGTHPAIKERPLTRADGLLNREDVGGFARAVFSGGSINRETAAEMIARWKDEAFQLVLRMAAGRAS